MPITPSPTEYDAALAFLYGRLNYERMEQMPYGQTSLKLDRMQRLLELLGNPQDHGTVVHIAGTKGKGSTANFVRSMLTAAGYSAGCYTSPHLLSLEERFAVDGNSCTRAELIGLVDELRPHVAQLDREAAATGQGGPTFFELTTAMAWNYFRAKQTDVSVIEVGLGGRLDSTNVCHPSVTVITSISFDHMRQLGNTLGAIAGEKAGIIKPSVPLVTGVTQQEPWEVIRDIARSRAAPVDQLGDTFDCDYHAPRDEHHSASMDFFRVVAGRRELVAESVRMGSLGRHQAVNGSLAWVVCDRLADQGFSIDESARRAGLAACPCSARIEIVRRSPTVLVDTAHNAASIQALVHVLNESFSERQRILILGASRDKDVAGMLHLLVPNFTRILCTPYLKNPRSMDAHELARHARRIAAAEGAVVDIDPVSSPAEAWQIALQAAHTPNDTLICATGSFFLAAEMKELLVP